MATAEQMAKSICIEEQGVFALLWDAKEDLVRALLILNAALGNVPTRALLLAPGSQGVGSLRNLIETRVIISETGDETDTKVAPVPVRELWLMFLQQASYTEVGPRLNGWRSSLRQSYGTILIIRHADFEPFQRSAPDLASFIGPRIFNASNLLSLFSNNTRKKLKTKMPEEWTRILDELPGIMPPDETISEWIKASSLHMDR
jgi:hypothetical protein